MKTNFENLHKEYEDIKSPKNLDLSIENGIKKAQAEIRSKNINRNLLNMCASLIVVTAVFTSAINVSPTFANSIKDIPILSKLVEVLTFVDGSASGGTITDGVDFKKIDIITSEKSEDIVLNFQKNNVSDNLAAAYKLKYTENPSIMSFEISGIRMLSAKDNFDDIAKSPYVKDIYTVMTLDDSMIRFNIVFNQAIKYEVTEFSDPASLVLNISKLNDSKESVSETLLYSLRTKSYKFSENFAHIEESFMNIDMAKNYRVIRDAGDEFIVEIEAFDSEASALKLKEQLELLLEEKLIIEKRLANELPKNIADHESSIDDKNVSTEESSGKYDDDLDLTTRSYNVSVNNESSSYYATVVLGKESITLYDEIDKNKVLVEYLYSEVKLSQLKGEASWILNIKTPDDSINISGVYSDFFENLGLYTNFK